MRLERLTPKVEKALFALSAFHSFVGNLPPPPRVDCAHKLCRILAMSRRLAGFLLSATLALPAFAQGVTNQPASPIPVTPQPSESVPNQRLMNPESPTPAQRERLQSGGAPQDTGRAHASRQGQIAAEHIRQTLAVGTVTLQAATLARTKAENPRVKQFAAFEEAEQNTLFEALHALSDPTETASTAAAQAEASTAPTLSGRAAETMQRLQDVQSGPAFDRAFLDVQIDAHREALAIQDRYLANNPTDRSQADIAMLTRGQIRQHLALLENIQLEVQR
jgi:putative membrane protein